MEIGNESFTKPKETVQEKSKLTNDQAGSKQIKKRPANENSNRKEKAAIFKFQSDQQIWKPSEKTRNQKDALDKEHECEFGVAKQLSRIRKDRSNSEERILKMLLAQDDFILRHIKQIEGLRKDLICKTTKLSNIEEDFKNQNNLQEAVFNMSQKHKDDKIRRLECELESKSYDIQVLTEKFDTLIKKVDKVKERVKAISDLDRESSDYVMVEEVEDEAQAALSKSLSQDRDTVISLLLPSMCFAAGHFIAFDIKPFLGGHNSINILLASVIWFITFFVISTSFGTLIAEYKDKKVDNSTRNNEPASTNKSE
ncbi:hypothetical protein WR25_05877 [Diploscapter pachys]|uniref:Uncharacterized protein n=1 Tax=Diploscapter pachys TaxID=2018661 RepID=A0A2A2L919_9BILA|nr:hypothetical protein WR25_05877 [Diploscapter pachys]